VSRLFLNDAGKQFISTLLLALFLGFWEVLASVF
jgi:hypothetical protein